jgi:AraC-like DNA-binding protein
MLLDYKSIDLDGVKVFEKVSFQAAGRQPKVLDNEACFMFLIKGSFDVRTPIGSFNVQKNEGFLTKCGDYFFEDLHLDPTQAEVVEAIGIYFHPKIIKELLRFQSIDWQQNLTQKVGVDFVLDHYKEGIGYYLDHPHLFEREMKLLKLKELLLLLSKSTDAPSFNHFISGLFSPQEYDFRQVIESNILSSLSIADLAYLCNMSVATFKRRFKELYQDSPAEYIRKRKLEKAASLLLSTHLQVNEIAFDCGFESAGTFNRIFKKYMGQTPTEYRLRQKA